MTTQETAPRKRRITFDRVIGAITVGCIIGVGGQIAYDHYKHNQAQTQASPEAVPSAVTPSAAASEHAHATTPVKKPVVKKPVAKPYALPPNTSTLHSYAQYQYVQNHVDVQTVSQNANQRPITGNSIADTLIINAAKNAGYQQRAAINPNKLIPYGGSMIQAQMEEPLNKMFIEAAKLHIPIKFAGGYIDSGTQDQHFMSALNPKKYPLVSNSFSQEIIDLNNKQVFKEAVPAQFSLAPSGLLVRLSCDGQTMDGTDPCSNGIKKDYYALAQENGFIPYDTTNDGLISNALIYVRKS